MEKIIFTLSVAVLFAIAFMGLFILEWIKREKKFEEKQNQSEEMFNRVCDINRDDNSKLRDVEEHFPEVKKYLKEKYSLASKLNQIFKGANQP